MTPRNMRQFGFGLQQIGAPGSCGIGPTGSLPSTSSNSKFVWPNKMMKGEGKQDIYIAGLDMQLVYIPGETECQMGVWIPSKKVFMPGDNFYKTFPNLYAIRGTVPRSVTNWVKSLDIVRKLKPEHLAPSHTRPVSGQAKIQTELTNYRDAIQFVHDQTLRLMNRGLHPVDVAKAIKLPPSLRDNPFLQSFYGTPEWSSRAVFDAYIGWFSGNPEELFPLSPTERGKRMVKSFGSEKIVQEAKSALEEGDIQWGLELSSNAFLCDPSNAAAKELRTQAILSLAAQQTSANGRNYLLTYLLEDHNIAPRLYPAAKVVLDMPLDIVFKRMAFSIKAENVEDVVITAVVTFKDLDQVFSFHIRNCVLEVDDADSAKRDLSFTMTSTDLREVLAGQKTIQDLVNEHKIESDKQDGEVLKFFSYFETGDEFMKSK